VSFLRYLVAGLAERRGVFPRSDKGRIAVPTVVLPVAARVAWQVALPADALKSMRLLAEKGAFVDEQRGKHQHASLDDKGSGHALGKPGEPRAKVTIEFRATARVAGADATAGSGHDVRLETSSMRGGAFHDAGPLFRDGARGESGIASDASAQ
jgi:hypothetical protein